MPLYILDTDAFSDFQSGHPRVSANVLSHPPQDVAVTAITIEESLSGWYTALRQARQPRQVARAYQRLTVTVKALATFPLVTFDLPAIARFDALLKLNLRVRGQDFRIAAIALEAGATVVTKNRVDFARVPGLAIVDWSV